MYEAKKQRPRIPFEKSHELLHAPEDELAARAGKKPSTTTLQRIKAQKTLTRKSGEPSLKMTTPKARELEKKYHRSEGFISSRDLVRIHEAETSELEKRCIAGVMAKSSGNDLSRAYAICRASLQKSGRLKKGGMELTKKGKGISGAKAKKKDHDSKVSSFEKHVVAARKK